MHDEFLDLSLVAGFQNPTRTAFQSSPRDLMCHSPQTDQSNNTSSMADNGLSSKRCMEQ